MRGDRTERVQRLGVAAIASLGLALGALGACSDDPGPTVVVEGVMMFQGGATGPDLVGTPCNELEQRPLVARVGGTSISPTLSADEWVVRPDQTGDVPICELTFSLQVGKRDALRFEVCGDEVGPVDASDAPFRFFDPHQFHHPTRDHRSDPEACIE